MKPVSASRGFTLIELLFVVAIVAILASIALPSYQNYVKKGHASTAASDLSALALSVENHFQRTLEYPTVLGDITTWNPASKVFTYTYTYDTDAGTYFLEAEGTGQMLGCDLKLEHDNTREPTSPDSKCGGFTW